MFSFALANGQRLRARFLARAGWAVETQGKLAANTCEGAFEAAIGTMKLADVFARFIGP